MTDAEREERKQTAPMTAAQIREQIMQADDIDEELVEIPQWNTTVLVLALTGDERYDVYERATITSTDPKTGDEKTNVSLRRLYPLLAILGARHTETKERILKIEDMDWLNKKSSGPVEKLANTVMRLSGLSSSEEADIKNGSEPEDGSGIGSQETQAGPSPSSEEEPETASDQSPAES